MPSVARELPLEQPLFGKAELVEHRRNILRYAVRFRPALNAIIIGKLPCRFVPFSETRVGSTHILLRASVNNVIAI
jgi:hypothetical protein